jgi:hypothetical protein
MNQGSDNHLPEELREKVLQQVSEALDATGGRPLPLDKLEVTKKILDSFAEFWHREKGVELPPAAGWTLIQEITGITVLPEVGEELARPVTLEDILEAMPDIVAKAVDEELKKAQARVAAERKAESAKTQFTKDEILKEVRKKLRRSPGGHIQDTLYACNMWLDFAPWPYDQWTEEIFRNFEDFLASPDRNKGKGYTKETQVKMLGMTKHCFDICKVDWPKITTKAEESDVEALPFETREIKMMVDAAKADKLLPAQAAYLAISTVFGLRSEELTKICHPGPKDGRKDPNDIDYDGKRIYIRTVKGGDKRWQALPDEIVPYLKQYDFKRAYDPDSFARMCGLIETKAGVVHISRRAWHGIRRSVDTALMVSLKENNIENASDMVKMFMRWKLSADMEKRYDKEDKLKNDRLVFKYHPFLAMWRD